MMSKSQSPHPLLSWLTRQLFMGSTTMSPKPSCYVCNNLVKADRFEQYHKGDATHGCEVVVPHPEAKERHDTFYSCVRMRMTNDVPQVDSDDLKLSLTTQMWGDTLQSYKDRVDIKTTRIIYNVSELSIAAFRDIFKDAVEHHYTRVPDTKKPLIELVDRMFDEM